MKERKKKQFSQRTSSKGTFVVVVAVATALNRHLDSSIGVSLINYTIMIIIIISRILNRLDPRNGYKSGLCGPASVCRPVLLVRSRWEEQTEGMMGDLGLDDGSSVCTRSIASQTGCIVSFACDLTGPAGRSGGGPVGGDEGQMGGGAGRAEKQGRRGRGFSRERR